MARSRMEIHPSDNHVRILRSPGQRVDLSMKEIPDERQPVGFNIKTLVKKQNKKFNFYPIIYFDTIVNCIE